MTEKGSATVAHIPPSNTKGASLAQTTFEFIAGNSAKFWEIETDGTSHSVHFGRIGTVGQWNTKNFESAEQARKSSEKLIAAKLKKGYCEVAVA